MTALLQALLGALRRNGFVAGCLGLVGVLAIANVFIWEDRQAVTRRHEEVRTKGEAMRDALTDYNRITAELAAVKEAMDMIDRNLLVEGDMAKNLGYFFQMETLSRVRLSQLSQLTAPPAPEDNPFKAIPFSLRVTGSYGQIIGFLREIETGPRLLRVSAYSFNRGDPKTGNLTLDLTVEILGSP